MHIAIVAGEASGDQLGAGLIRQLKKDFPQAEFFGVGGPLMQTEGFKALYQMQEISMIGLEGVFSKLPRIIQIRRTLFNQILQRQPNVFIGIDVPDFNLGLEKKLTSQAVKCIHYVSPTIWAWRSSRIKTIKQAVAHMLVLFPFEVEIYQQHGIPVTFVGHPLADEIDQVPDQQQCRGDLGLSSTAKMIALLPGSRHSEIQRHTELFLDTAKDISDSHSDVSFVISAANAEAASYIDALISANHTELDISVSTADVKHVISASDLVLAASGTVTLETALMQKPLVMAYKVSKLSELMVRCFAKVNQYALPNFLLDKPEVPEFVQSDATVKNLSAALIKYLQDDVLRKETANKFIKIKDVLQVKSNEIAASVVSSYLLDDKVLE